MTEPGAKHDQGKHMMRLLPWGPLKCVVRVLEFGMVKYTEGGWRHVKDGRKRYLDAALRHLADYCDGEELDSESGLHHVWHAATDLLFCIHFLGEP